MARFFSARGTRWWRCVRRSNCLEVARDLRGAFYSANIFQRRPEVAVHLSLQLRELRQRPRRENQRIKPLVIPELGEIKTDRRGLAPPLLFDRFN